MQNLLELDAHCRRVLGALLEKEQTTPDYYPLTLNSLISACNQTTNRDPILSLKQYEVLRALHALERHRLVERVTGPRADRWSHLVIDPRLSRAPRKALLTVLMLRGSQTLGELKSRTERMHPFPSLESVEETLRELAECDPPLVLELSRQPGQKEPRWRLHSSGEEIEEVPIDHLTETVSAAAGTQSETELLARIERLEQQVGDILRQLSREDNQMGERDA